ncbi:WD40 repeat-like protein [Meredithblackwellia eburnea MCA 4105]
MKEPTAASATPQCNGFQDVTNIIDNPSSPPPPSSTTTTTTTTTRTIPTASTSSAIRTKQQQQPGRMYRQISLFDAFHSDPPAPSSSSSATSSSIFDHHLHQRTRSSSSELAASSPSRGKSVFGECEDGMDVDLVRDDGDDNDDEEEEQYFHVEVDVVGVTCQDRKGKKRRRLDRVESDDEAREGWQQRARVETEDRRTGGARERKVQSLFNVPGKQTSVHGMLMLRGLGLRAGMRQVSMKPILRDMVSNNETQVFRCPSLHHYRNFAPPFALAFSHDAKQGGKQIFAVADEEGSITFIDAARESQWDPDYSPKSFRAHNNAIFDLAWSNDDTLLATASGDQTVKLYDTATQVCISTFVGHTCTIKNVAWDPFDPHMLSTASRDGTIHVWDSRVSPVGVEPGTHDYDPALGKNAVVVIKNAHGTKGKAAKGRSALQSVTAVSYLRHQPNLLASAGSCDGVIKLWDLRKSYKRRVHPDPLETNEDAVESTLVSQEGTGRKRPHGISSMVVAPDGERIYALSTDSSVYSYSPHFLSHPHPLAIFNPPTQSPCGSFYVRLALSPDSRFLACGSSDSGIHLWDTCSSGTSDQGVRLVGHEKEVSGLDWGGGGGRARLASCSDDLLVRVWEARGDVAERRKGGEGDGRETRWKWSGEVVGEDGGESEEEG